MGIFQTQKVYAITVIRMQPNRANNCRLIGHQSVKTHLVAHQSLAELIGGEYEYIGSLRRKSQDYGAGRNIKANEMNDATITTGWTTDNAVGSF